MTVEEAHELARTLEATNQRRLLSAEACIVLSKELLRLTATLVDEPAPEPVSEVMTNISRQHLCLKCAANRYQLVELLDRLDELKEGT
jgi:hypothetical protein